MTDERRRAARRIFMEVADLTGEARDAALDESCGTDNSLRSEVEALLRANADAGGFMNDPTNAPIVQPGIDATVVAAPHEQVGQMIGRYKLLEPIGEGGFGAVWAAEQREPVRRRVALKVIKLGMDTQQVIARFEAERQALAMMDHPNIAKVLDAGATETGRPYFVMELVKGVPILDYCDTAKMDTRARLDLFMKVCHAIQHAHQKGIIHRDIKPSNVMVTLHDGTPVPKVIDFGIAKATNQELTEKTIYTQQRQMIGTPAYMSPEQAEMTGLDIDTRSDVYSLGVLLYELLTGTTPFENASLMEAGFAEMMRIIREETPHKPSTRLSTLDSLPSIAAQRQVEPKKLGTMIRGDLDWIVMKALEKDRTRRYETANGFAADIQRFLINEPVVACPPSAGYRLRKFIRRNRAGVTAVSLVATMLVLGVAGTTWGMVRASQSARVARQSAEEARLAREDTTQRAEELQQVADFQSEQLGTIVPELMGARLRDAIVDAASEDQRAELRATLGRINFTNIGLESMRTNVFDPALEVIGQKFTDQPLVEAQLMQAMANTLRTLGLLDAATTPQERALAIRRETLGDDHPDTLSSINIMGLLLEAQGKFDDAEPYFRDALEGNRRVLGDDHPSTLISLNSMGMLLFTQGKLDDAEPYFREALEGFRRVLGDDHEYTLASVNNLGNLLQNQGRFDEALACCREALDTQRRVFGDDHPSTLTSISSIGVLLQSQGSYDDAEPYLREALEGRRRVLGDAHPRTLASISNVAIVLWDQKRYDEAEPLLLERYATLDAARPGGRRASELSSAAELLVQFYEAWGKPDKAAEWRARVDELTTEPGESP